MGRRVRNGRSTGGLILLTGATGYIGRHLLPLLLRRGEMVRCLVRRLDAIRGTVDAHVEVCEGDALDAKSLARAMNGVDTAYYLIHSMGCGGDFEALDRLAAGGLRISAERLMTELSGIQETLSVYPRGKNKKPALSHSMTHLNEMQKGLYDLLNLERFRSV